MQNAAIYSVHDLVQIDIKYNQNSTNHVDVVRVLSNYIRKNISPTPNVDSSIPFHICFYWKYDNVYSPVLEYETTDVVNANDLISMHAFVTSVLVPRWVLNHSEDLQTSNLLIGYFWTEMINNAITFVPRSRVIVQGLQFLRERHPQKLATLKITGFLWDCIFYRCNEHRTIDEICDNISNDEIVQKGLTNWSHICEKINTVNPQNEK